MQFTYLVGPGFFFFILPVPLSINDPHRRILFSPGTEVNIDGLWLLDDLAE